MSNHQVHMQRCFELAQFAKEKGDAPVCSILVRGNEIIAEGVEAVKARCDITAHAETEVIRAACRSLKTLNLEGCALYTNVEPCFMCISHDLI